MLYFVYERVDPETGIPGYIGISNNPNLRHKQHLATDNNAKRWAWEQRIIDKGGEPKMSVLEVVEGEKIAREREKYWIRHYVSQGVLLTNIQGNEDNFVDYVGDQGFYTLQEARWARFFQYLDIPYEYRTKGCKIDGKWLVPSFWLPNEESIVDIPQDESGASEEEMAKIELIALYLYKCPYLPRKVSDDLLGMDIVYPPSAIRDMTVKGTSKWDFQHIELTPMALLILQRLHEIHIQVISRDGCLLLNTGGWQRIYTFNKSIYAHIDQYQTTIQRQLQKLPHLMPLIKEVEQELIDKLDEGKGGIVEFDAQYHLEGEASWSECLSCGNVTMNSGRGCKSDCPQKDLAWDQRQRERNSQRILEAYIHAGIIEPGLRGILEDDYRGRG